MANWVPGQALSSSNLQNATIYTCRWRPDHNEGLLGPRVALPPLSSRQRPNPAALGVKVQGGLNVARICRQPCWRSTLWSTGSQEWASWVDNVTVPQPWVLMVRSRPTYETRLGDDERLSLLHEHISDDRQGRLAWKRRIEYKWFFSSKTTNKGTWTFQRSPTAAIEHYRHLWLGISCRIRLFQATD